MIKLKHILHPVDSTRKFYQRFILNNFFIINQFFYRKLAERKLKTITRSKRDTCWCGGNLLDFSVYPSQGICSECGCFVNLHPPVKDDLKKLYSLDFYWRVLQKSDGQPSIEYREANDLSDGRVDCWLSLIKKYGKGSGRVIEVGCGPAVLLKILANNGYDCLGVEICDQLCEWIKKERNVKMICGIFPKMDLPSCDIFLAFDVLEHAVEPEIFAKGIYNVLHPGGIALIQTPTLRASFQGNDLPLLDDSILRAFKDIQHLFIFTDKSLRLLLERANLSLLDNTQKWHDGSEITVAKKV